MKAGEALKGFVEGKYGLDTCGHYISWIEDILKKDYEHNLSYANGGGDGTWSSREGKTAEETDEGMREFYQRRLDRNVDGLHEWWDYDREITCDCCGEKLLWTFKDGKITFNYHLDIKADPMWVESSQRCKYETPEPIKASVELEKKIKFANFFASVEDAPEGKQHKKEFSLSTTKGQVNVTNFKQANNVAFGQMGNMSVAVLINKAKDHIVVVDPWRDEPEYEDSFPYKDYKQVGDNLSLCVWRWEAMNSSQVTKEDIERLDDGNLEYFDVSIKPGTWEVIHYYETNTCPHPWVYSELKLKA